MYQNWLCFKVKNFLFFANKSLSFPDMLQYKSLIQETHGLYFAWQVSERKTP